ncbi:transposase [uncultured Chryseobacterium sp.]|uniref:transposase n=1 Tax=uncultured Chryseobacterium sp. TaxID=259322 RepID=UPI0025ECCD5A|nr:transposase [uncultured Chryseobacterium sp.]
MPNTYTQIYLQAIFATKGREIKIMPDIREEVEKYICGIFANKKQKVLAIYANPDHLHVFFSYKNLQITIPDLIKTVKIESTNFINEKKFCSGKFSWQEGYGAFSYAKSQKDKVVNYILNQEKHHVKKNFKEEYLEMLEAFEIEFKDEYLFEFYNK